MTKPIFVLLMVMYGCVTGFQVPKGKNLICWEEGQSLVWKDFKGRVPGRTPHAAITYVNFQYEVLSKNSIRVSNCFVKDKSWTKRDEQNPYILKHEQYHFHISEIFARRIRQDLVHVAEASTVEVQQVFDKWMERYQAEQTLYDQETSHSRIRTEQLRWENKIDKSLTELSEFRGPIVHLE